MNIVRDGDLVVLSLPIGHTGPAEVRERYDEAMKALCDFELIRDLDIKVIGFEFGPVDSTPSVLFVHRPEKAKTCLCE